jgi:hypothetical protein
MHGPDDIQSRFNRRFRAIETHIPDRPVAVVRVSGPPRARLAGAALGLTVMLVLVAAVVVLPGARRPSVSAEPSPTARTVQTGEAAWAVMCNATSDSDCDGAVGLYVNNLARSWKAIRDESGARLTVEPRACPTINGLTARQCWDVTAVRPSGPFCMVVAHDANDPRYPAYFEIGGQDGTGRAGGPPVGWPMCRTDP